jgi:polar amino acid transport system substrate-binding protein
MNTATRTVLGALVAATAVLAGCSSTGTSEIAADCKPESTFTTNSKGTLAIIGPDYPPLFTYDNTSMSGVDGKILSGFAKANCLNTAVRVLPAAGVIEAIKGGQGDIAAGGWYPTEERAQIVDQSKPAYADPAVLVGKNPSPNIETYQDKPIGTTQGYLWTADLQKWAGDNAKLYASPDAVFQDLLAGRIEVALMAVNEAAYRLSNAPADSGLSYVKVTPTPAIPPLMGPAVTNFPSTKGNTELTAAINAYLDKIRADGELGKILQEFNINAEFANPSTS